MLSCIFIDTDPSKTVSSSTLSTFDATFCTTIIYIQRPSMRHVVRTQDLHSITAPAVNLALIRPILAAPEI